MRDPRRPRHLADEFKRQIVGLHDAGKPKREIMEEYGLGKSTVERWIKSMNTTGSPRAADNRAPSRAGSSSRGARTRGSAWRPTS